MKRRPESCCKRSREERRRAEGQGWRVGRMPWQPFRWDTILASDRSILVTWPEYWPLIGCYCRRKNKYRHVGAPEEETSFDTELLPRSASDGNLVRWVRALDSDLTSDLRSENSYQGVFCVLLSLAFFSGLRVSGFCFKTLTQGNTRLPLINNQDTHWILTPGRVMARAPAPAATGAASWTTQSQRVRPWQGWVFATTSPFR